MHTQVETTINKIAADQVMTIAQLKFRRWEGWELHTDWMFDGGNMLNLKKPVKHYEERFSFLEENVTHG